MKKKPVFFSRKKIITQTSLQMQCLFWVLSWILIAAGVVGFNVSLSGAADFSVSSAFWTRLAVQLGIVLVLAGAATLWISNRFAGPLLHLQQVLEQLAEGDFTVRLRLRKNDELFNVADSVNETIRSLQDHAERDCNLALRINDKLETLLIDVETQRLTVAQISEALSEIALEVRHVASCYKMK